MDGSVVQAGEVRSARIESLRALAALSVLAWHVLLLCDRLPGWGCVRRGAYAGQYGVYLFFALTGFLLFLPLARREFGTGRPIALRRYAMNRVLRILPLYYVVLTVLLVVEHGGGTIEQWLRFGTMTQSFFADTVVNDVDSPMWSLAVELQFYVLLPLIALALSAVSRRSARTAAILLTGLAIASLGVWMRTVHHHNPVDFRWAFSLPVTFLHFVPGMLLALIVVRLEQRPARWQLPGGLLVLAGVGCWVVASYHPEVGTPVVAVASFLVLAGVVMPSRPAGGFLRLLDWRVLALLGTASYSLYLLHYPIVASLGHHLDVSYWELLAVGLAVCVPLAGLSYRVVERPFLRLRRRWGATAAVDEMKMPLATPAG